ncbi:hypothetical protein JCM8097_006478 [Rhodosporidiobolus ruineniae]
MLLLRRRLQALYQHASHLYQHNELFRLAIHIFAVFVALHTISVWFCTIWQLLSLRRLKRGRVPPGRFVLRLLEASIVVQSAFAAAFDIVRPEERAYFVPLYWIRRYSYLVQLIATLYFVPLLCFNLAVVWTDVYRRAYHYWLSGRTSRAHQAEHVARLLSTYEHLLACCQTSEQEQQRRFDALPTSPSQQLIENWQAAVAKVVEVWNQTTSTDEALWHMWRPYWFEVDGDPADETEVWRAVTWQVEKEVYARPAFQPMQSYRNWVRAVSRAPSSSFLLPPFFRRSRSRLVAHLSLFFPFFLPFSLFKLDFQRHTAAIFLPPALLFLPPYSRAITEACAEPLLNAFEVCAEQDRLSFGRNNRSVYFAVARALQHETTRRKAVEAERRLFWAILDEVIARKR